MEAVEMGWDFWRIEWPNAAVLFALAAVPCVAIFSEGAPEAHQAGVEMASGPELALRAPADEQRGQEQPQSPSD
jgi:hypothetical protein